MPQHRMALHGKHVVELSAMAWNGKEWGEMAQVARAHKAWMHGKGFFIEICGLARHGKEWYGNREFEWELGLDKALCGMSSSWMERYF